MEKETGFLADDIREYRLVASPSTSVLEKVKAEKRYFLNRYQQKRPTNTASHITLVSFLAKELMEETIIRWVQRVCSQQKGFQVMLNNYNGKPPHTIYLRVQDPSPFRELAKQLKVVDDYVRANGCPAAQFTMHPYVSIAKGLPEPLYTRAMFEFSQRTFCESFVVNDLRLLRKEDFGEYKLITVFRLLPSGIDTK
jgi:hypothetical protein